MERPDLRLRENKFLIPMAPSHYTPHQKRQWREEHLQALVGPPMPPPQPIQEPRAAARGRVAASSFPGGGRQNPSLTKKLWSLWGRLFGLRGVSGVLVLWLGWMASGHSGIFFQVARVVGAAATLSEATTDVATQALNLTGALTASATDLVLAAAKSSLSASSNAWRGVDVVDLKAVRCSGVCR